MKESVRLRTESQRTLLDNGRIAVILPTRQHAVVEESHEMDRGDYWELDCAAGWGARRAIHVTFGRMPAQGADPQHGPPLGPPSPQAPTR